MTARKRRKAGKATNPVKTMADYAMSFDRLGLWMAERAKSTSLRHPQATSLSMLDGAVASVSVMDFAGEGSIGAFFSNATGTQNTTIYGGPFSVQSTFGGAPHVTGPGFGKYRPQYAQAIQANRFSQSAAFYMNEGPTAL